MWLLAWRLSSLHEAGSMSHEQASLVKAQITLRGREVVALGREMLGGNGAHRSAPLHVAVAMCRPFSSECIEHFSTPALY